MILADQKSADDVEGEGLMSLERGGWHASLDDAWCPNAADSGRRIRIVFMGIVNNFTSPVPKERADPVLAALLQEVGAGRYNT